MTRLGAVFIAACAAFGCARHHTARFEGEIATDGDRNAAIDAGKPPLSVETFATYVAAAMCSGAVACCARVDQPHDESVCRGEIEARLDVIRESLEARGYVYRPVQAEQCLDELGRAAAACVAGWYQRETCGRCDTLAQHLACATTFSGDAEEGDDCEVHADCGPSNDGLAYCDMESRICTRARRGAALGEACIGACAGAQCVIEGPHPMRSGNGLCNASQGAFCDRRERECRRAPGVGDECEFGAGLLMPDRLEALGLCEPGAKCDGSRCVPLSEADAGIRPPSLLCVGALASLDDDYTACWLGFPHDDAEDDDVTEGEDLASDEWCDD